MLLEEITYPKNISMAEFSHVGFELQGHFLKLSSKLTSLHPVSHFSVPTEQQDAGNVPFRTSYQSVLLVTPQHLN